MAEQQAIRIKRFDPEGDARLHEQVFTVTVSESTTVLDALQEVKDFQDGSLTFRKSCRQGICGSCAMRINDRSRLACKTRVREVSRPGEECTVAPLASLPVIKDLVVDMAPFWAKFRAVEPYLIVDAARPVPEREYRMSPERATYLHQFSACIQCGACYSACPMVGTDPDYLGPAALAKAYRYTADPRDTATDDRVGLVAGEHGVYRCHSIFNCTEVCPVGVDPTMAIERLKNMVIRRRFGLRYRPEEQHTALDAIAERTPASEGSHVPR